MNPLVAHRGCSGKAPENTMAAFNLALNEASIGWIELDVQLSKDGVPVVIHDYKLNRTTNGKGNVKDFTYSQLSELDAGEWFNKRFKGEKIPGLEEVLHAACGRCRLNIEIKTAGDLYPGIEQKVIQLIHDYHMQYDCYITSFDYEVLKKVRETDSIVQTGLILSGNPPLLKEHLKNLGVALLAMDYKYLTHRFVAAMINEGYKMMAWTVNGPSEMIRIAGMHPELMICTDHPERFIELSK